MKWSLWVESTGVQVFGCVKRRRIWRSGGRPAETTRWGGGGRLSKIRPRWSMVFSGSAGSVWIITPCRTMADSLERYFGCRQKFVFTSNWLWMADRLSFAHYGNPQERCRIWWNPTQNISKRWLHSIMPFLGGSYRGSYSSNLSLFFSGVTIHLIFCQVGEPPTRTNHTLGRGQSEAREPSLAREASRSTDFVCLVVWNYWCLMDKLWS